MDIQRFHSALGRLNGVSSPARFRVRVFADWARSDAEDSAFGREFEFWCVSCQMPGMTFLTADVDNMGYGPRKDFPTVPVYEPVSMQCIVDGTQAVTTFFTRWCQNAVNINFEPHGALAGRSRGAYPFQVRYEKEYVAERVSIQAYDEEGFVTREVDLHQAFPKHMGALEYNWATTDSLLILPVTLMYYTWTSTDMYGNQGGTQAAHTSGSVPDEPETDL